jgi:tetratricopeptide (TPR) repeat protein
MNRKEFIISELKDNPNDPFNQYLMALEYLKENNRGEAISIFDNIYNTSPNYLPVYYIFALNLIEMKRFKEAQLIIEKGIQLANSTNEEKVKNELSQLLDLYFD